jgi:hypothetical protein
MRWAIAAVVAGLAAVVAVNVLLLSYTGDRHDPVGRLSPVANLTTRTGKARPLPPPATADDHTDITNSDD